METITNDARNSVKGKSGYQKIKMTCQKAREQYIQYVWIDTCCIDKTSSAELSEAINSMYKWYQNAKICYVFLSDLTQGSNIETALPECKWFSRGWCLQELIAPKHLWFYDEEWGNIGSKTQLKALIADITRIDEAILEESELLQDIPVARRMLWASKRVTTRVEDIAYCLLGIFGVNMPMLYGEGDKAFIRPQEEILKRSNDLSIFFCSVTAEGREVSSRDRSARSKIERVNIDSLYDMEQPFGDTEDNSDSDADFSTTEESMAEGYLPFRNLFARSPKGFANCQGLVHSSSQASFSQEFSLTNNGFHFKDAEFLLRDRQRYYTLPLGCLRNATAKKECEMVLVKVGPFLFARVCHCWHRLQSRKIAGVDEDDEMYTKNEEAYIIVNVVPRMYQQLVMARDHSIRITYKHSFMGDALQGIVPRDRWDASEQRFITLAYALDRDTEADAEYFWIACGLESTPDRQPWLRIYSSKDWKRHQERIGKMAGLKYLNKNEHWGDLSQHQVQIKEFQVKAEIMELLRYYNYPGFEVILSFSALEIQRWKKRH